MYVIFQLVQYTICYKNLIMLNVFNFLLLNKKAILLPSCVKFQNNTLDYYAKYSLFDLNGSKLEVAKKEFWAKICFKKNHYFLEAKTTPKN